MIEICRISHAFDGRNVLRDISLTLAERRIAIIGANGSGKTTLARTLNGLVVPQQGDVLVDGISARKKGRDVRRLVGYVFQNPEHQIVMPTVEEDLAFGLENMNLPKAEIGLRVSHMLAAHGLDDRRNSAAHLLSVSSFDEPMNSLDLAAAPPVGDHGRARTDDHYHHA